jgi:hypothetical protein
MLRLVCITISVVITVKIFRVPDRLVDQLFARFDQRVSSLALPGTEVCGRDVENGPLAIIDSLVIVDRFLALDCSVINGLNAQK